MHDDDAMHNDEPHDDTPDNELSEALREAARAYHPPPRAPREAMWERIEAARRSARGRRRTRVLVFRPRWIPWAVAAGLLLGAGIALGRFSMRSSQPAPIVAVETGQRAGSTAYRLATIEHLSQSETFLTLFRASIKGNGDERLASATARQLLATNRLLLDSPAARDSRTRLLLQDLELVLAEIAQLSPRPPERDLELIREGLERDAVLSRLRTAVPAGTTPTQGAL